MGAGAGEKKYNKAFTAVSNLFEELPAVKAHREAKKTTPPRQFWTMPTREAYEAALSRFQTIEREMWAMACEIDGKEFMR